MSQISKKYLLSLLILLNVLLLWSHFSSPNTDSQPYHADAASFKSSLIKNCVLPKEDSSSPNLEIAWQHQQRIRNLSLQNNDLFPDINPEGVVPTKNKMGVHLGFCPSMTVQLAQLIDPTKPLHILEIGSGYGFDAIALVQNYPLITVTALEIDLAHINLMNQLMGRVVTTDQRSRISSHLADFLNVENEKLENEAFDIVIISKVLHFYDEQDILRFLEKLQRVMKPGGYVVMSNVSNKCGKLQEFLSWVYGGYQPTLDMNISSDVSREQIRWIYFFSPEDMDRLAKKASFIVKRNTYVGTAHEGSSTNYGFFGEPNVKEFILHTVLQKPGN